MQLKTVRRLPFNNKAAAINILLTVSAFVWYSCAFAFLTNSITALDLTSQLLPIITVHFTALLLSLFLGVFLSSRISARLTYLSVWSLIGVFLSAAALIANINYLGLIFFAVASGINFGLGLPTCLGYFAATTDATHRSQLGGLIILLSGICAALISTALTQSYIVASALAIISGIRYGSIKLLKPTESPIVPKQQVTYPQIFSNRTFLLYFIPWLMFLCINSLSFPINQKQFGADLVSFSSNIEFILGGVSAVMFGFFADSKGRKRLAVAGFALLGLGYAILGFTSSEFAIGWWLYTLIDGVTWGIFVTIFLFSIWGDIGEGKRSEKIYAIGLVPYLLSTFIRYSIGTALADSIKDFIMVFSFFSFFLFIAVMPLVFAPETMSEQTLKNSELKGYLEKAKKQVEKIQRKNEEQPQQKDVDEQENQTAQEESDEYKKAQELAEKYY
jgi:MFS family permease